ncbi:cell division protein FtsQ/DivIB [Frigoriflavimonas asaccharolytica]|uniref:Cell division protein FtsQ n=1 Tax=Frigoriflavimonas asaccharolytica TaxID=2735899 RepID=A0A8J8G4W8_9FLAO|nr:cell division protein FtsQ [Frigoriflavimonas asaccharolytica]NRS91131.1 cell division protein FtsQ [Frigoriflavimonas asaccharolytica]
MKNKWRILKIAITVILFGFLLSFSLKRFNEAKLETIKVKLNPTKPEVYFIDEKEIRSIVQKNNPTQKIGDVDIPKIEKLINNLPSIDSANVFLNLNGTLNVDIRQKVPVFRLTKNGNTFYVDAKGNEFPLSKTYSHPSMLVNGNVEKSEYPALVELVKKIEEDPFSKKYFIGISKIKGSYNLLPVEGNYKVEIGDLERIDLKVKGFKTFMEKVLSYKSPDVYNKISLKYENQIVTTLNPNFAENDSLLALGKKEMEKLPDLVKRKQLAELKERQLKKK